MMNEETGEKAFDLHSLIVNNEKKRRQILIENMGLLDKMQKEELYKSVLGDEEAEWYAYLGQIDVFYTRSRVVRLLRIRQKLVEEMGFSLAELLDIPETRLENIASLARDRVHAEHLLEKARHLIAADWREEMNMLKGKVSRDECKHDYSKFEMCKNCGEKHKISNV